MSGVGQRDGLIGQALVPTRRELGVVYLVAVGVLFTGVAVSRLWVAVQSDTPGTDIGEMVFLVTTIALAASLIAIGGWLFRSPLSDERALAVAHWSAFGLAVPTAVVVLGFVLDPGVRTATVQLAAAFATGGVLGALYGGYRALEAEHEELDTLHQRNRILQQVLRHNIRNGMNVVEGYSQLLEQDVGGDSEEIIDKIQREARAVVDLADVARNVTTAGESGTEPVDLAVVVANLVDILGQHYPTTTIETDLPESAWIAADASVEVAVWHLLEFEIHRGISHISVTVTEEGAETRVSVADVEGSLEPATFATLDAPEDPFDTRDGMALWMVEWLVESQGGDVTTRTDGPGTRVDLVFESCGPGPDPDANVSGTSVGAHVSEPPGGSWGDDAESSEF